MALASSVTCVAGALQRLHQHARCGTSAASGPATCRSRSRVCGDAAALLALERVRPACAPAGRPPRRRAQASIRRSIRSGVIRQRAASCTSTQSCSVAPARAQLVQAVGDAGRARGAAAGHDQRRVVGLRSKKPSPGATTTSGPGDALAPRAKAASVCQTMGWPAMRSYCLGPCVPARLPVPAQGIKRIKTGIGALLSLSWHSVHSRIEAHTPPSSWRGVFCIFARRHLHGFTQT